MAPGHRRVTQGLSGDGAQLTLDLELTPDDGTPGSEVVGIGVVIAPDSRGARVQQVVEGGPSEGKIHVGDIIVRVEQLELAYRPFRDAMGALRGSVGSRVNVTVVRESGAEDTLQIERARVRVPPPSAPPSAPSTSTKP
jgi:C-terminal processing protease CtpA/Prc